MQVRTPFYRMEKPMTGQEPTWPDDVKKRDNPLMRITSRRQRLIPGYVLVLEGFMSAGLMVSTVVCALSMIEKSQAHQAFWFLLSVLGTIFAGAAAITVIILVIVQYGENRQVRKAGRIDRWPGR